MYLDTNVKEVAEAKLGRSVPSPDTPKFDTLVLELYGSDPALAESLQRGVIFEDAGDPRDAARKADAWARFKQTALALLFLRRDRFTGEWVEDRNKTTFWVILALALCAFAFFWYQRASTAAAFRQPVSAQQASVQGAATGGAVTGGTTGGEPSGATLPLEPASTSFNLRASLDEFSAAQMSGGAGETAPTGGAPVATPAPAPAPAPAPEAEPIGTAIVLERADTPNETVAFARPEQEGSDVLRSTPPQASSSAVAYRAGASEGGTQGGGGATGSAIVFQRDPSTSSAPPSQGGGETQADPFQQTLDTPVPFYEQSTAAQPQPGAAGQGTPTYAPGETLEASLDTEIATPPGESITTFARAADGSTWQGQATLNQLGRVEVTFTLLQNGAPTPTTAIAYGLDNKLGLDATVRNEAPNIAADLVGAALRGVTDHAETLSENQSIVQNGETVVVQDQATPLEWAIAGSAAELFSPPEQERSLVRVAEVPEGTPFTLRVTGQ